MVPDRRVETALRGKNVSSMASTVARQESLLPDYIPPRPAPSLERQEFVEGLFEELHQQLHQHKQRVAEVSRLRGRIEVGERALIAAREHLLAVLESTADEHVPDGWPEVLAEVRFVGVRLGVACADLLEEHGPLTTEELHAHLNSGQFRFRSSTPLREIHGALIRNSRARKDDDRWHYVPPEEEAVAS